MLSVWDTVCVFVWTEVSVCALTTCPLSKNKAADLPLLDVKLTACEILNLQIISCCLVLMYLLKVQCVEFSDI